MSPIARPTRTEVLIAIDSRGFVDTAVPPTVIAGTSTSSAPPTRKNANASHRRRSAASSGMLHRCATMRSAITPNAPSASIRSRVSIDSSDPCRAGYAELVARDSSGRAAQPRDERRVCRVAAAALDRSSQREQVAAQQRRDVEPQPREHAALQQAVAVRLHTCVCTAFDHEPVDLAVVEAVHEVLEDAVAAVGVQLLVEVIADAARRDLDDEFGRTLEVAVLGHTALSAGTLGDAQQQVGLRFVVEIETHRTVAAAAQAGRQHSVEPQPDREVALRLAVLNEADR